MAKNLYYVAKNNPTDTKYFWNSSLWRGTKVAKIIPNFFAWRDWGCHAKRLGLSREGTGVVTEKGLGLSREGTGAVTGRLPDDSVAK